WLVNRGGYGPAFAGSRPFQTRWVTRTGSCERSERRLEPGKLLLERRERLRSVTQIALAGHHLESPRPLGGFLRAKVSDGAFQGVRSTHERLGVPPFGRVARRRHAWSPLAQADARQI